MPRLPVSLLPGSGCCPTLLNPALSSVPLQRHTPYGATPLVLAAAVGGEGGRGRKCCPGLALTQPAHASEACLLCPLHSRMCGFSSGLVGCYVCPYHSHLTAVLLSVIPDCCRPCRPLATAGVRCQHCCSGQCWGVTSHHGCFQGKAPAHCQDQSVRAHAYSAALSAPVSQPLDDQIVTRLPQPCHT